MFEVSLEVGYCEIYRTNSIFWNLHIRKNAQLLRRSLKPFQILFRLTLLSFIVSRLNFKVTVRSLSLMFEVSLEVLYCAIYRTSSIFWNLYIRKNAQLQTSNLTSNSF